MQFSGTYLWSEIAISRVLFYHIAYDKGDCIGGQVIRMKYNLFGRYNSD